jgi:hypothetical protein
MRFHTKTSSGFLPRDIPKSKERRGFTRAAGDRGLSRTGANPAHLAALAAQAFLGGALSDSDMVPLITERSRKTKGRIVGLCSPWT